MIVEKTAKLLTADPIVNLLQRLQGVKPAGKDQWKAKCPCHDDRQASLSIKRAVDGRALVNDHAGCRVESIIAAVGLKMADLFPARECDQRPQRKIVATYDYVDTAGELLYQCVRYQPKDFRQRRPDGHGRWIWDLKGVNLILYRLPELLASAKDRRGEWVFIPEGEKDVDNILGVGLIATCGAMGAGKWKPAYCESLRDRRVCVIADRDAPGRKHAQQVASALWGIAAEIKVVEAGDDHRD